MSTNGKELTNFLESFFNSMLSSEEVKNEAKNVTKIMGENVVEQASTGGDSGYDYDQSGGLLNLLQEEIGRENAILVDKNMLTVGYGNLEVLDDAVGAKRQTQVQMHHITRRSGHGGTYHETLIVITNPEPSLPKWILAEFGSGERGDSGKIPQQFKVPYFGHDPNNNMVLESMGVDYSLRKPVTFMTSESQAESIGKTARPHPGTLAGHIFSNGLENSKQEIHKTIGRGIERYLGKGGGQSGNFKKN